MNPFHYRVTSASKSNLILLIERAHHFHFWEQYLVDFCHIQANSDYSLIQTGFQSSGMNGVYNINLEDSTLDERIQIITKYFTAKHLPFSWIIGSCTKPIHLKDLLVKYGFIQYQDQYGMIYDLDALPTSPKLPLQSKIKVVDSLELRDLFAYVSIKGFGLESSSATIIYQYYRVNCVAPPTVLFLGFHQNTPVATSLITFLNGVGSVFNVTVLPEYRRKGWGTAVIYAAILEAKRRGFRYITVQARDEGRALHKSVGFCEYTKISGYFSS